MGRGPVPRCVRVGSSALRHSGSAPRPANCDPSLKPGGPADLWEPVDADLGDVFALVVDQRNSGLGQLPAVERRPDFRRPRLRAADDRDAVVGIAETIAERK